MPAVSRFGARYYIHSHADPVDYEILVNGVSRTWRDLEGNAIAAGRALSNREKGAGQIVIINRKIGERCQIKDDFSSPAWLPMTRRLNATHSPHH